VGSSLSLNEPRRIVLDKPFWVVMRETGKRAYFLAHISNANWLLPQN
jgi:hypothetical protein